MVTKRIIGKRFGKLLVLAKDERILGRNNKLICLCDCGKEVSVWESNLMGGGSKSCGCLKRGRLCKSEGEQSFNHVLAGYKYHAKEIGLGFNLTVNEFKCLTQKDCFYCGEKPNNNSKPKGANGNFIYNGIDRIDSSNGYTMDNVVPCCGRCNQAKMSVSQEDFILWIKRVHNHLMKQV